MKRFRSVLAGSIAALAILALAQSATAQASRPVVRADLSGSFAWLTVQKEDSGEFRGDRWGSSLYGGFGAGWYWTDHVKTELDFGAGTESRAYLSRSVTIQGQPTFQAIESSFQQRTLGISQQFQFFRNVWFHPHVAAGANITWERVTDEFYPVTIFVPPGPSRVVEPGRTEGPRTTTTVSPFFATGFKAYMNRRSFFRSDLRVSFHDGVDDVLLRFGFGIDF